MKKILLAVMLLTTLFAVNIYAEDSIYLIATKELNQKTLDISQELNDFTDKMIKTGKCSAEEKQLYDKKIKEYDDYIKSCKNAVWQIHISGAIPIVSYLNPAYEGLPEPWDIDRIEPAGEYYSQYFEKAFRRYAINAVLYSKGWRNLSAYLAGYALKPQGAYVLDGMKVITHSDSYVELDISNAKEYQLSKGYNEPNEYGYGYVKIVSPNNNTYYFTGFSTYGDWNGYFVPTGKGLELNCEYSGRKRFLLNSSGRSAFVKDEAVMLSDIFFNEYLKQSNVNWSKKGISFTGKKNEYTVSINVPKYVDLDHSGHISEEYDEIGNGSSMRWNVISVNHGEYEYYWNNANAEEIAILENGNQKITYNDKIIYINVNKIL